MNHRKTLYRFIIVPGLVMGMVLLNIIPIGKGDGSIAFSEHFFKGFERSRGFPFRWWTRGDDEGIQHIDNSDVQGDSSYLRDFFPGEKYPHLCLNSVFLVANIVLFLVCVGILYMYGTRLKRRSS